MFESEIFQLYILFMWVVPPFIAVLLIAWLMRRRLQQARETLNGQSVIRTNRYVAIAGERIGGYGGLLLTDRTLYFVRWLSGQEWQIPFSQITTVQTTGSYQGRSTMGSLLLEVEFVDDAGIDRSVTWIFLRNSRHMPVWKERIKARLQQHRDTEF